MGCRSNSLVEYVPAKAEVKARLVADCPDRLLLRRCRALGRRPSKDAGCHSRHLHDSLLNLTAKNRIEIRHTCIASWWTTMLEMSREGF